ARLFTVVVAGVVALPTTSAFAAIPSGESSALVALYNSTAGDTWTNNTNWCSGGCPATGTPTFNVGNEGSWRGILCDAAMAHVTAVQLRANNLVGTLPPELSNLTSLITIDLSLNQLSGAIPPLTTLPNLTSFDVSGNRPNGPFPNVSG